MRTSWQQRRGTWQAKANRTPAVGFVRTIYSMLLHGMERCGCFTCALVFNMSLSDEKSVRIINPKGDVWVFVNMLPCPGITGFSMEWVLMLPFVCLAGLEVGPRSLVGLDKCSTTDLHPSPHCSLCY